MADHLRSPLCQRRATDTIAWRHRSKTTVAQFLADVAAFSDGLPDQPFAFNLCVDRYQFLVAFCAVISRGQCNLLPPNRQSGTLADLAQRYPDSYEIADESCTVANRSVSAPELNPQRCPGHLDHPTAPNPDIPLQQLCAMTFTSGSTGASSTVAKFWRTIEASSAVNQSAYLGDLATGEPGGAATVVATVPPQHMYGLESTIMMPLFAPVAISHQSPLLPADVAEALAEAPAPRVLVTTPVHLKALLASAVEFPGVDLIISATAPLDEKLASAAEARFGGELREIYGCSEAGSFALRRTAHESLWTPFAPFSWDLSEDGSATLAAGHLPQPVELGDILKWRGQRFSIVGRKADLINIAGKRGSLADINRRLLAISGIQDGVVFEPGPGAPRLAAMVVLEADNPVTRSAIAEELKRHLDPVFIPRPVVIVDSLPRSASSKLPKAALLACYEKARSKS